MPSRVPWHQCGDGPGGWALECTAQAEAGCTGGPIHRGIHWEDWSIPQSCIIAWEQVVSHIHGEVGNFLIMSSSVMYVMFQIKWVAKSQWRDHTARRPALGHSEGDFWDQVADGASMSKVCCSLLHSLKTKPNKTKQNQTKQNNPNKTKQNHMTMPKQAQKTLSENTEKTFS